MKVCSPVILSGLKPPWSLDLKNPAIKLPDSHMLQVNCLVLPFFWRTIYPTIKKAIKVNRYMRFIDLHGLNFILLSDFFPEEVRLFANVLK